MTFRLWPPHFPPFVTRAAFEAEQRKRKARDEEAEPDEDEDEADEKDAKPPPSGKRKSVVAQIIRCGRIRRGEIADEELPTDPTARAIVLAGRKARSRTT